MFQMCLSPDGVAEKAEVEVEVGAVKLRKHGLVGVLRLDYDYEPAPGDIDYPGSFNHPVVYRVVPGFTFKMCRSGTMTPQVEKDFEAAVRWLVDQGVSIIIGDCGFMMFYQQKARELTHIPVALSALCQLPSLTINFGQEEQVAVLTADGYSLEAMRSIISSFRIDPEYFGSKFLVYGCQDVNGFEAVAEGEKVNTELVARGIVELAQDILVKNQRVRAFLLECTELPPYADAIRHATGLPVYDAITAANMLMTGFEDNPRFGINDWKHMWDGRVIEYSFAGNLTEDEKARLVSGRA